MTTPTPSLSTGAPDDAPAATPESDPHRYRRLDTPAGGGALTLPPQPDLEDHVIADGDELVYDHLPVAGERDRYGATAFSLDVVLDDGTRLAALGARDQHGTDLDPVAQAEAKRSWVDQWNRRTVDLTPWRGRRVTAVIAVVGPTAEPTTVFLGDVVVRPRPARPTDLLGWVDTRRGTHASDRFSRGNDAPIVSVPHGGLFGLPMTDASSRSWPYRWQMSAPSLQAFATSHIPSPWIGDRGVLQLMPSPSAAPSTDRVARALAFDRDTEHAGPDRYEVELDGVAVVLAAARHALGLRLRSRTADLAVVVDHLGEAVAATWRHDDGGTLLLDVLLRDEGDGPDHHVHVVLPHVARHDLAHEDGRLLGVVAFDRTDVDVLVGVSTIDAEQARRNAVDPGGLDAMLEIAADAWRAVLARVEVPDADAVPADVLRSIAGGLGRLHAYPNAHDEDGPDGPRYRSPVDGVVREGTYASNNGFWDTYRTAWPLLGLLAPATTATLADGFVQHFTDAGWVARWSAPGPVDCMTGTTSDTVFAGLAAQGVPLRLDAAHRSALQHASVAAADARVGRKGLRPGIFRGYIDTRVHEGMSWTLDNAINDAAAARLARALLARGTDDDGAPLDGRRRERLAAEADHLSRRALGYRAVFHRDLGFFLGRDADGAWRVPEADFDPAEWGHDYTETNAWGTAFTAPHDGAGLATLHGGEAGLGAALDAFFATPETADPGLVGSYGVVIHEMSEARDVRMGMLGLSNQPAHHIPLTYCFAGRHDDAHRIIVEARDRLFVGSELGQGYPGDEDNGEMSAWYLFAVLGLYPLVPGTGELVLTPPLLPRVVLHPEGRAHPLEITAENAGAPYVREVRVDGEPWDRIALPAAVVATARSIAFVLSDEPTGWAADTRPTSASAPVRDGGLGVDRPLRDLLAVAPGTVADDTGDVVTVLEPGESVDLALEAPAAVGLTTVTLAGGPAGLPVVATPVTVSWRLDGVTASGDVVTLDERAETFDVAGQTRPFHVRPRAGVDDDAARPTIVAVRLTALSRIELAQLEVFDA
ncbi:glycoside hydrolase domain-containing protein [Serinibacter arcticus]|uniref:Alpha-1,2-mannosidase n=1 Tax=Serinibacter arcticus TaxID=1655435 RepID=A0A4Z1E055_9MICO|nr:glycoside hydrolase domain-containing protein [Serinibacter arcticus]TGO04609.1 Alpha-1,2-mannosidase [Serinibacter arcticus]